MVCNLCSSPMRHGLTSWHFECPTCGLEASTLEPAELSDDDRVVDEVGREAGLESLRKSGFAETVSVLSGQIQTGRLLDVGCAHGWFLDEAKRAGFDCTGIEPSQRVAEMGIARGHTILSGYFPEALSGTRGFDVIAFNDVFEHIPDAQQTMRNTADLLATDGVLTIAIPSSRGLFYRVSKFLAKFGLSGPFERMWQMNFSSPHLYYFNSEVLTELAARSSLVRIHSGHLPSIRLTGLWKRLNYDTLSSPWKNTVIFAAIVCLSPAIPALPADIDLLMFRKAK